MGNEIVIPGYPPIDALEFNPAKQNGYLSGSLTNPTPGTSRTNFQFSLSQAQKNMTQLDALHAMDFSGTVASGATVTVSSINFGGANEPVGPVRVRIQALGSTTTGHVFVITGNSRGGPPAGIDVTAAAAAGIELIVPNSGLLSIRNDDAAGQLVHIFESPALSGPSPALSQTFFQYDTGVAGLNLGLVVSSQDVYRIRRFTFAATPNPTNLANPPQFGDCYLAVFKAPPGGAPNQAALLVAKLTPVGSAGMYSGEPRDAATNPAPRYYTLDAPYDILGIDGNPIGTPYSPFFQVNLFGTALNDGAVPVVPGGWALVDYFPGANQ